jgi:hypothetical protein
MATATRLTEYPAVPVNRRFSWSGIFAGTFLFLAIEATFGILGVAIFATATNPHPQNPVVPGISVGVGIWMVVLSIIALYFSGKLASRLSGATDRNSGMYIGLVTYGMCVFSSILVTAFVLSSTVAGSTAIAYAIPTRMVDMLVTGGYWLFAVLVLAMIAGASGGMHGSMATEPRSTVDHTAETKRIA